METLTMTREALTPVRESFGQENDLSLRVRGIDPKLDLEAEILRLKTEQNAVILAHYYHRQNPQSRQARPAAGPRRRLLSCRPLPRRCLRRVADTVPRPHGHQLYQLIGWR